MSDTGEAYECSNPEPVKRWDDPSYWKWVLVGHCRGCGGFHVLREERCWTCEQVT